VAKLKIIRESKTRELNIAIGEFPKDEKIAKKKEEPAQKFGLAVINITPQIASRFDLSSKEGVIVSSVSRGSAASEAGFRRGDIIIEINNITIKNLEDYNNRLDEIGMSLFTTGFFSSILLSCFRLSVLISSFTLSQEIRKSELDIKRIAIKRYFMNPS